MHGQVYHNRMITTINEFRKIFELRQQQVIPFEEPEYRNKHVHEHIKDALMDLSVMRADTYFSNGNPDDEIDALIDKAFEFILKEGDGDDTTVVMEYIYNFVNHYDPNSSDRDMYSDVFIEYALKEDEDILEDMFKFSELAAAESDVKSVFSEEGWIQFKRIAKNLFDADIEPMVDVVTSSYDTDELGLISCWRVVDYVPNTDGDYYVNIMAHGGVGVYWSWDENSADSHNGNSAGHSITLHGKISVEDVDWYDTTWKNAYHLRDEKEIRTKNDSKIMIVGFHDNKTDQYVELDDAVVVKTGS
jgi:hypothetical protein